MSAVRKQGELPTAAIRVIAAWLLHLRGNGVAVRDDTAPAVAGSLHEGARAVAACLDPDLAHDVDLINAVTACAVDLS